MGVIDDIFESMGLSGSSETCESHATHEVGYFEEMMPQFSYHETVPNHSGNATLPGGRDYAAKVPKDVVGPRKEVGYYEEMLPEVTGYHRKGRYR